MKIYLGFSNGGSRDILIKAKAPHGLISYFYIKEHKLKIDFTKNFKAVMLDSGAFSADSLNKPISIEEYAKFCKKYKDKFKTIISLDVIGDVKFNIKSADMSYKNFKYLKSQKINALPVFHQTEDFKWLDLYCKNYDYVGLGGVGNLGNTRWIGRWLTRVFARYPKHKFHGFAITSPSLLLKFPFYSVDSTSWTIGGRYGQILKLKDFGLKLNYLRVSEKKEEIKRTFLHSSNLLDKKGKKAGLLRNLHNAEVFVELEKLITRVWEKRGIKYD